MAKILLVEDDIPLRRLYESALQLEYSVIATDSSSGAIKAIETEHPDLIVLDLHSSGAAMLDYIETHARNLSPRVIVMTGSSQFVIKIAYDCIVEVLNKPVTTSMLLRVVNAALTSGVR